MVVDGRGDTKGLVLDRGRYMFLASTLIGPKQVVAHEFSLVFCVFSRGSAGNRAQVRSFSWNR